MLVVVELISINMALQWVQGMMNDMT